MPAHIDLAVTDLVPVARDLRSLALECIDQARVSSTNPMVARDAGASLAAKNWSAAALSATQAWMTAARGPGR